jgi:hypothetical protein
MSVEYLVRKDDRRLATQAVCAVGCPSHKPGEWRDPVLLPENTSVEYGEIMLERMRAVYPATRYRLVEIIEVHTKTLEVLA